MLTDRETQVLVLIAGGNSIKEIAYHLRISQKTADCHRTHLMQKLNIHKSVGLAVYAVKNGIGNL